MSCFCLLCPLLFGVHDHFLFITNAKFSTKLNSNKRKTAAQLFVLFPLNLLKLYVSSFYTDHTFSEEVSDYGAHAGAPLFKRDIRYQRHAESRRLKPPGFL